MNHSSQVIGIDDRRRTAFGNHAFCAFAGKVVDACAGPHTGGESFEEYIDASIDTKTKLYRFDGYSPGTAKACRFYPGVTAVV
jgi:hypothetical protein